MDEKTRERKKAQSLQLNTFNICDISQTTNLDLENFKEINIVDELLLKNLCKHLSHASHRGNT